MSSHPVSTTAGPAPGNHVLDAVAQRLGAAGEPLSPRVVALAALLVVPAAEHATVTLLRPRHAASTLGATDDVARAVDALQHRLGDGPCLEPADAVTVSADLSVDPRWPRFGPECSSSTGIRSMACIRLPLGGDERGALSLYASTPGSLDHTVVAGVSVVAPFATLSVEAGLRQEEVRQLRDALAGSRTIGAAVGVLMAARGLTRECALQVLRTASTTTNVRLRDLAAQVVATGSLPDHGRSPRRRHE